MKMTFGKAFTPVVPGDHFALTECLAAPRKVIERDFLQMGEQLIACTRLLNETSEAYDQMAGVLAGPDLSHLASSLQHLSELVSGLDRDRIATQAFLKELKTLTDQFPDRIGALKNAVRTLRMFFMTARVAAATSGNRESNLAQFAEDFSTLGTQLDGSVASFANAFARMRDNLDAAREMNEQFGERHAMLLDRIAAEQTRNLEAMEQCRLWAEGRVSAHSALNQRINSRVSRAVSTLQVGDSTRQRVEHVEEALHKLPGHDDTTVSAIHKIAAAQLRGAVADFDCEIGTLATSLQDLVQDTQAMLDSAASDSETLLTSGDSALGAIDSSLHETARMLEQYERGNAGLSVAIDQLVEAVGNMLDHVSAFDDIRQAVHLLSLNAALRSRTLDEDGKAFQRAAMDLRTLNDESNDPVAEVMGKLEKSETILRGFLEARTSANEGGPEAMQSTLDGSRKGVSDIANLLRARATVMAETGPKALDQLRDATSTVTDRQDFCAAWRKIAEELDSLAGQPDLHTAGTDDQSGLLSEMYKSYSMTAEREIHNSLLGRPPEADDPTKDDDGGAVDDIFF